MEADVPQRNANASSTGGFILVLTCAALVFGLFIGSLRTVEKLEYVGASCSYEKLWLPYYYGFKHLASMHIADDTNPQPETMLYCWGMETKAYENVNLRCGIGPVGISRLQ
jgi:biotin transporter BioY